MKDDAAKEFDGEEQGQELGLEDRLRRLEEILGVLEADDLELDRALALFEEGVGHVRKAEEILSAAELKVEELIGGEENLILQDFEEGETG